MPVMDASSSLERTSLMSVYCRWGHAAFGKERKKSVDLVQRNRFRPCVHHMAPKIPRVL